jgi:hypothetical protein
VSTRRFPMGVYWVALAVIVLLAALPVISVVIAGTIADANGCRVDEGSVHPCLVGGTDLGELLYTLGVLGWLMLLSIPAGIAAIGVWAVILLAHRSSWKRKEESAA